MKTKSGNRELLLLWIALFFLPLLPAAAQEVGPLTAENLRDACEPLVLAVRGVNPISQEDPGAMLCLGFLSGWFQAMEMVPDRPYCLPASIELQPGDVADLLVSYVDGHPERASATAHEVMLETFTDSFPCLPSEGPDSDGASSP